MSKIKTIRAREILDSRGHPTIESDVILASGAFGRAAAPSGASTGNKEAIELRDGEKRYQGKGVCQAVKNVNTEIQANLEGCDAACQKSIDDKLIALDGTANKHRLGANAILSVSLAVAKANAIDHQLPLFQMLKQYDHFQLPVPMMNVINGGAHAANNVDIQEFIIIPLGFETYAQSLQAGSEIFHTLKKVLLDNGYQIAGVGDEGGYAPDLPSNEKAIEVMIDAITQAGYQAGHNVFIGLDIASSELYEDGQYHLKSEDKALNSEEFADYLAKLVDRYPIITIEDGMDEDDWEGWKRLTKKIGDRVQLVGDDLFVTNTTLLQKGIDENIANSILIKFNQIGTLTETLNAINKAHQSGYTAVISHRSGETSDTTIADLAVATCTGQIKTGSLSRSDRVAKYNQLLRIEEALKNQANYPGAQVFKQK